MEPNERVRAGLRAARAAVGETQAQVAEAIGVSEKSVANWENGRHRPPVEAIDALADHYGITVDALVGRNLEIV